MATASDGNGSGGASSTSPRRASASSRRHAAPTARSCLCQVVLLSDLNYRIYLGEAETRLLVKAKNWSILLQKDQLLSKFSMGRHFEGWQEGLITFSPTYKYHPNSDQYYWCLGEKRAPAWCDRILWRGKGLTQIQYETCNYRLSDHRPVRAAFHAECEITGDADSMGGFMH